MPLESIDHTPPPFFRQGASVLSKAVFFGLLAVLLMVSDERFKITNPLRAALATAMTPLQWLVLQPLHAADYVGSYFVSLQAARTLAAQSEKKLTLDSLKQQKVEQLQIENDQLRKLLDLRPQLKVSVQAVQVLYETPDPYSQRLVVDKGDTSGIAAGSPVIDDAGVLGQVTRVYPWVSEVTLLTDRDQSIPVMNARTGERQVAFGNQGHPDGALELRFVPPGADVQVGDLLTTSGIDGVYPAGLHVATVSHIERRTDAAFARIHAQPMAHKMGRHLLILQQAKELSPPPFEAAPKPPRGKKLGGAKEVQPPANSVTTGAPGSLGAPP
jgi:rod shape-determining protein MreC